MQTYLTQPSNQFPANVVSAAQAAATAIGADANYCQSVMQPGTPTNAAVHAFKLAWNAMPGKYIPAGKFYEPETAFALKQVLDAAPIACPELHSLPPRPYLGLVAPSHRSNSGTAIGIGLLAASAAAIAYLASR